MKDARVGLTLRLPPELHAQVFRAAEADHSSLNRWIMGAVLARLGEGEAAATLPRSRIKEPYSRRG